VALAIVAVLAVGGGAFVAVSALTAHKNATQAAGQPTSTAPAQPTASGASATPTPPASSTATPSSTVALSPAVVANPAAARVQALLERYFTAINRHDYEAYRSIHTADAQLPYSSFVVGYGTTTDSTEELVATSEAGAEELATVTFISHQSPAKSVTDSSCTKWKITLYLLPQGNGYLITSTPPGYHAVYMGC
jgi:hypothetical protein